MSKNNDKGFIEEIKSDKKSFVSRRDVLKMGAGLLAGSALPDMLTGLTRAAAQSGLPARAAAQSGLKHIYVAADDHTDYVWRQDAATVQNNLVSMLDYYLDQIDATIGNQTEHQMRWNCDGHFWVWLYEKNRSAAQFTRLISRIRDGHVSMPLNALISCYGGNPTEAFIRGMYYPGKLERKYNLDLKLAYTVENQTLPYGIGALWAGGGAKYTWRGICNCTSKIPGASFQRPQDIYWWVGPDGSRMLMKWYSFLDLPGIGSYAELRDAHNPSATGDPSLAITALDNKIGTGNYPFNIVGGFGLGWDIPATYATAFVSGAQAQTNGSRMVHVSNEQDFFEHFESTYGAGLPNVSVTYGNEWELYQASLVEVTASVKRSTEKLRGAEGLATLVSLKNGAFMNGRESARDLAWMNLGLFWEHNWMADGGQTITKDDREAWTRQIASEIAVYVDTLQTDAVAALGSMIGKTGTNTRFFAFNPLSWARTDAVDFPYPSGSTTIHVVDVTSGAEVPSQIITIDSVRYLRVLAQNVPPVGYKVFEIRGGAGTGFSAAATVTGGNTLDNGTYQLVMSSRGAINSLIDHTRADREFILNIGGRSSNDFGSSGGTTALNVVNAGAVSVTLEATVTGATNVPNFKASITLFRNSPRIDIRNRITQNFSATLTWAFSFNLTAPDTWHEEVGAIIRAKKADSGGHYATSHARYDWLTLNHFADMTGTGTVGVTLSNADCQYVKLGNSSPTSLDATTAQMNVLAGGQVDGTTFGILNQGGDSSFLQRFALQTHSAYDPAAAMRFSLEHQNPLVAGAVTGGSQYPATSFALLSTSNLNVLLWALKPADDGLSAGHISRWWNITNSSQNLSFSLPGAPIISAQKASHIETPSGAATVSGGALQASFATQQMATFLLKTSATTSLPGIPTLLAPADLSDTPGSQPVLSWGAPANATRYELQLKLDAEPDDTDPVISLIPHSYTPPSPLLTMHTYFWRVRAANSAGALSGWSEMWQFRIASAANASPSENYFRTAKPKLSWTPISWAVGYVVEVSRTTTFAAPISSGTLAANKLSYTLTTALDEGTWYWRVKGLKSLSPLVNGTPSPTQSFIIELP
ncbi:MAG: glycoside hydrolase [Chloroflexota bacterium]